VTDQSDAATASPAPNPSLRVEDRHPSTQQVMRYFEYSHRRNDLAVVSKEFHILAHRLLCLLPDGPELTVALRKLLEAKDAVVRQAVAS
jgi:hypothetical protein